MTREQRKFEFVIGEKKQTPLHTSEKTPVSFFFSRENTLQVFHSSCSVSVLKKRREVVILCIPVHYSPGAISVSTPSRLKEEHLLCGGRSIVTKWID